MKEAVSEGRLLFASLLAMSMRKLGRAEWNSSFRSLPFSV